MCHKHFFRHIRGIGTGRIVCLSTQTTVTFALESKVSPRQTACSNPSEAPFIHATSLVTRKASSRTAERRYSTDTFFTTNRMPYDSFRNCWPIPRVRSHSVRARS